MLSSPTRRRGRSRRSIAKAGPGEGPLSQRGFQALTRLAGEKFGPQKSLSHFVGEGEHLCCRNCIS